MSIINSKRRQFIGQSALGIAAATFPGLLIAKTGKVRSSPTPGFKSDIEIEITARKAHISIINGGPLTRVQKYYAKLLKGPQTTLQHLKSNYLGPVLNYEKGQKVRIYFYNQLSKPSIIHWHGLHVPQKSDGHPMYSISPGERYVYEFVVLNRAGTSFYHSHSHQLTAEQVYQGLAGLITVTDEEEKKLELPNGEYDLPLVIQDRNFNDRNQLQYSYNMHSRMMGFLGETILVNGKPNVVFAVKSRAYRFRALNGSNSRIYKLGWDDGTPITAIGTDAGLLEKPESRPYIMLAPGERIDLWLDFSGRPLGSKLVMYSLAFSGAMPPMYEKMKLRNDMSNMEGELTQGSRFPIATFMVTKKTNDSPVLPKGLVKIDRLTDHDVDNFNNPIPIAISMKPKKPQLNGQSFVMDKTLDIENVPVGSIKKIKIFHDHGMKKEEHTNDNQNKMQKEMKENGMNMNADEMKLSMAHPIHLHGQQYQVISRKMEGMRTEEYETVKDGFIDSGWKDTLLVMPGEEIEIIKPFQDFKGLFLYHCHNLEHEDLGMMRQFNVY